MDMLGDVSGLGTPAKIFLVDLLLSGDNAVVIAMACRSLPPRHARNAAIIGTVVAILLRLMLTTMATLVLQVPYLKLLGAVALVVIAVKLILTEDAGDDARVVARDDLFAAIGVIVVADAVMSIDNVVAVAAAARGELGYLLLGLGLSVPLLVFGSLVIARMIGRYPLLIPAGGAVLGWMAGEIAVSDPAVAGWMDAQSFGLEALAPVLVAAFVLLHARIMEQERLSAVPAFAPPLPPLAGPEPALAADIPEARITDTPAAENLSDDEHSDQERGRGVADTVLLVGMIGVPLTFVAILLWAVAYVISAARQY